jgi:cell wall-associated NlpC family hydrolase
MIKGQWIKVEKDTYYTGTDGAALTGLQTIESKQYYFDEDGVLKTSTVVKADGVSYMAGEDGQLTSLSDASGAAIAAFAQKYVGNPYVYGGTSLTQGADCSGFCYTVFQTFGIQLMRVADDQMKGPSEAYQKLGYKKGVVVSDKDLEPGDLVFYGSASYASHVAIYIGDNKVVHAANSRLGIIISDMDYVRSRVKNKSMRYWA